MTCREVALVAWAAELGAATRMLQSDGTTVVRHGPAFAGRRVAFALATGSACVVTVPDDWYPAAEAALGHLGAADAFDATRLARVFGTAVRRVVGPAWQGHVDAGSFAPADPLGTRLLSSEDRAALDALAAACPPGEWDASSVDPERPPVFGCLVGGVLVAAGTLVPWRERFWNVGIVTHPEHRGRGYGRAVVGAMTRHGARPGLAAALPDSARQRHLGRGRPLAGLPAARPHHRHPAHPGVSPPRPASGTTGEAFPSRTGSPCRTPLTSV